MGGDWPFDPPLETMEARVRTAFPTGAWAYEPKWDGFRCLSWSGDVRLDSRSKKPLLRYFPELEEALAALPAGTVVDGEVVVVVDGRLDFDALQQRIHPAASRIDLLSNATPAQLIAFDLLAVGGEDLRPAPFATRRERLVALLDDLEHPWHLTPSTRDVEVAKRWFTEFESAGCDGIVAKELECEYRSGQRAMVKLKHRRSVDVVVGGYRLHKEGDRIGSLLLGLYDDGQLHFIGHCSGFGDVDRVAILERLQELEADTGFGEGVRRPGGISRWTGDKDLSWVPLAPEVVVEVSYDQLTGDRFRHATRFERWRPDKAPSACTIDQLERPEGPGFADIVDPRS
jgi:ATP-dependent DNA ligase